MPPPRFSRQPRYQPLPPQPADSEQYDTRHPRSSPSRKPYPKQQPKRPQSTPKQHQPSSSKASVSWPLMAFILTSDLIGSGVLVVPKAYAKLGWIPAQLTLAILFVLTTYTGSLMVRVRRRYPHITCYADLFEAVIGPRSRAYARLCCSTLLFFVVCGSIIVQADSWNAVFPDSCNLIWVAVAALSSCLILQIRSMPNIGLVSIISVLLISVPNIAVLLDLKRMIAQGTRTASPTALFGSSIVDSFVATLDLVFAFAGHVVFFELMLEMANPDDFSKALWASQIVITIVYFVNGTFVYNLVGPAPWLKSPINLSMTDGLLKTLCQVLVIAHVSLAIGVDGTVFIRSVQTTFQPPLMRKLGLAPQISNYTQAKVISDEEDPRDIRLQENMQKGKAFEDDDDNHERRISSASLIASPNDWSMPAILWWLLWSAATLCVVAILVIAVGSFDDIIGLTASLIASQTTVSWPAMFHYLEFYAPKDSIKCFRDYIIVALDVLIFFAGIYLFLTGTVSNSMDIARLYARSPRGMFSCT